MKIKVGKISFFFDFLFFAFLSFALSGEVGKSYVFTLYFSFFHECIHLFFILILGKREICVNVSFFGMRIDKYTDLGLSLKNEVIIAISAPLGNLILGVCFFFFRDIRLFYLWSVINFCLFFINILPLKSLDGGRCLFYFISQVKNQFAAQKILNVTGFFVCVLLITVSVVFRDNFSLFCVSSYLTVLYIYSLFS